MTTCWKVGRFVQRIVSARIPEVKRIRSAPASARHAVGSLPCFAICLGRLLRKRSAVPASNAHVTPLPRTARVYGSDCVGAGAAGTPVTFRGLAGWLPMALPAARAAWLQNE